MTGILISFEGGEGSGKTTQARILEIRLNAGIASGRSVKYVREPGETTLGYQIRQLTKTDKILQAPGDQWKSQLSLMVGGIAPMAEVFLFAAARAQLVAEVLKPTLESGAIVIADRYGDSTLAYQGYGRGVPLDKIRIVNDLATQCIRPQLTLLLDVSPEVGFDRIADRPPDLPELQKIEFHQRVHQGYLELAEVEPERWLVVDGALPQEQVAETIRRRVEPLVTGLASASL